MPLSHAYLKTHLLALEENAIKSTILTIILWLTNLWSLIEPYFFGRDFVITLTILLMGDMVIGMIKHIRSSDFSFKIMFHKFTFKLAMTAVSTVSAKSIINIHEALDSSLLIGAVKLTIALYLFGNVEKNICKMTEGNLCFKWFIDKIKSLPKLFSK